MSETSNIEIGNIETRPTPDNRKIVAKNRQNDFELLQRPVQII